MELVSIKERHGECFYSLKSQLPVNFDSALKLIYRISTSNQFSSIVQSVDEPWGVDSDWKHERGNLVKDLSEADFVNRYSSFEIGTAAVLGVFDGNNVVVAVLPADEIIRINFPEQETEENRKKLVKFVEEICNGIAEEE